MESTQDRFTIDIVSDIVCPWCYIGKRNLEAALASLDPDEFVVRWHPFELNPDLPGAGIDRKQYLDAKFGARADDVYARVRDAGMAAGIAFDFERIARQPNTRQAHRLIAWAQATQDADALVERLFRAYFVEGRFIGDSEELVRIATDVGIDEESVRSWLASDLGRAEIGEAESRAQSLGITGVPFFIFDGRVALSGAHPPETIGETIARARSSA
ncbi:MAG TPA: DsbA family oxidoreductase [Casimicrobiaceae bacterium]|nr:DsbA family oxidoreductase [Casimicrobiaceae bacterium]